MEDADARAARKRHRHIGKVNAVLYISVSDEVVYLIGCHERAVRVGFRGEAPEVRDGDDSVKPYERGRGKVGDIRGYLARGERRSDCLGIDDAGVREVYYPHPVLHLGKGLRVYKVLRLRRERDMKRDVVGFGEYVALRRLFDIAGEPPRRLDREVWVATDDLHTKAYGGVSHKASDSAEADNAEGLAEDLGARKFGAFFLYEAGGGGITGKSLFPLDAIGDAAGGEEERAEGQLLHAVGVRAGGIEDTDARLRTALDGNIRDRGAGAGYAEKLGVELHIGHDRRAHHNGVGTLDRFADHIVLSAETGILDA